MIYFVRHGQSEANVILKNNGILCFDKHYNTPLTDLGKKQAKETAQILKNKKIDIIITSELDRAIKTAEIINENKKIPMVQLNDLNERKDCRKGIEGVDDEWHKSYDFEYTTPEGIEDIKDFKDRVVKGIEYILEKYGDKNILIVAHGGVSHVFRRYFSNGTWEGNIRIKSMKNCEVAEFDTKREKKR